MQQKKFKFILYFIYTSCFFVHRLIFLITKNVHGRLDIYNKN